MKYRTDNIVIEADAPGAVGTRADLYGRLFHGGQVGASPLRQQVAAVLADDSLSTDAELGQALRDLLADFGGAAAESLVQQFRSGILRSVNSGPKTAAQRRYAQHGSLIASFR